MIIEVGALYIIFKTCRVTSQLYPEESGKRLEDIKNYKNGIQLLCANSDPLDTIVTRIVGKFVGPAAHRPACRLSEATKGHHRRCK